MVYLLFHINVFIFLARKISSIFKPYDIPLNFSNLFFVKSSFSFLTIITGKRGTEILFHINVFIFLTRKISSIFKPYDIPLNFSNLFFVKSLSSFLTIITGKRGTEILFHINVFN